MRLNSKITNNGISINFKKDFNLFYPKKIWQSFPEKEFLLDNLTYLLTISLPFMADTNTINYNISKPRLKKFFDNMFLKSIPSLIEDYKPKTEQTIKQFKEIKRIFQNNKFKQIKYKAKLDEKAVIPFSCGKDSLLTLAVSNELNLDPIAIYINDTVSPIENIIKLQHLKKISNEFKIKTIIIRNEIEQLNDFEFWNKDETGIIYGHMMNGFCLISLPILNYFKTKYIILGNQQDMNFKYINKNNYSTYPVYDQSIEGMQIQNKIIKSISKASILSLIEPLTNIAVIKILFNRYPEFAKYQVSCDSLDASYEKRWCYNCSKCARLSLFMLANNINPKTVNFNKKFLEKEHQKLYTLFKGKEIDNYEKSKEAYDQQLLAFYLSYKNNVKGYLIEKFKKEFLEQAKEREDELYKKFFSLHSTLTIPSKLKKPLLTIYKEELS